MLHFDANTGLYPDSISEVRETVRQDWITAFRKDGLPELDTDPETPAGQLIDSETAAIVDKDSELLFLSSMFNPLTSQGVWQDALGKIYFLNRKFAQKSETVCECMGLQGTVIPKGARIRSSADATEWSCAETVAIPASGVVDARFTCSVAGAITASPNTLTQIITVTPGWDTVTNPTAASVGREVESQLEFETRRYNSVAANARGSLAAIYGAIANIMDVLDCVVLENTTNQPITKWGVEIPGHSVWITVVGGDDTEIAEAIYRKKDAGCGTAGNTRISYQDKNLPGTPIYYFQIERPEPLTIGVRVSLKITNSTLPDIVKRVKDAIIADFNGNGPHGSLRVGTAQEVFASRFYCSAISAGVDNLTCIDIKAGNGQWADSIIINADKNPVLSSDSIQVVIAGGE